MSLTPLSLILMTMFTPSQQHEQILPDGNRAGFLIGDGAGVGKGRTIAGVIYENYLKVSMRTLGSQLLLVHCLRVENEPSGCL